MRAAGLPLLAFACWALFALSACADTTTLQGPEANPPTGLQPTVDTSAVASFPATDSTNDPNVSSLDMQITKSMLYAAGIKHGVNPYLVMGLAWHESGWQASVVSSAGAVGVMQVMPATAAVDGPKLLNRDVNLYDPGDNIDLGTAIIKHNLDAYHDDLAKALCAYYAGGGAVTEWATMRADCRHYVWAVYNAAIMFRDGKGPV
jgi:soluble lytic murein transglycosylase-like protein